MPSIPKSYRAAQITEKGGEFKIIDVQTPELKEGEVLVKVLACGVCHSDMIVKEGIMPARHEIVGDVVAVHASEKKWKVGQRVGSGWHGGHDGTCRNCTRGDFVTCENQLINGITRDGGYAEYVVLRTEAVAAIPDGMDPAEAAPLLCAGLTVYNSLRNQDILPGDIVAVQGLGGLGHLAVQYSRAMGFRTVALSSSDSKRELATKLGAHDYITGDQVAQLNALGGAKVIVCTAPSADVIKGLVEALKVDGTLLILAVSNEDIPVTSMSLISKRRRIQGWPSGTAADSEDTLEFTKLQDLHCQIEKFHGIEKAAEAYQHMISGKARFRAVLIP